MRVCRETIYTYLYAPEQSELKLWEYLPRKQVKRRKRPGRKVKRVHIPDRVSIHERPAVVEIRTVFGHWEGDSIVGKRSTSAGIHTEVERISRKLMANKIAHIAASDTLQLQLAMFSGLPQAARQTTTLDNGLENAAHSQLRQTLGIQAYFAYPYSSWQRGRNEYNNGLVRRYVPKKTDFTGLTLDDLNDIVEEINNRSRKVLAYRTPN